MAEIVGLITGIGTIVATAFTIAKTISTVANDLGTAGSQIRAIATDTKAIAFVLRDFKGRVTKNSHRFDSEAKSVLKETVALCTSEIGNMQTHLMPLFRSEEGRKMELKQRAKWLFAKSKVSTTKASLDSMKVTLGLLLHTMEYMEGDVVEDFIEEDIHEMIATSKGTKEKFLRAQRIDMTVEVIYDRTTSHQTPYTGTEDQPQPPTASTSSHEQSQLSDANEATNHTMDLAIHQWASNGLVVGSECQDWDMNSILPAEFGQASLPTERALIETLSDESFLQIADHMRLQRKVAGFALVIIAQPQKSEGHVFDESEQTEEVNDGARRTDEAVSDRSHQKPEARTIDDDEGQETISTCSVHLGLGSEISSQESPHEAQNTAALGQRPPDDPQGRENHPRRYRSHAREMPQEHAFHEHEARTPRRGGPHRENPSYPDTLFDEPVGGASAGHQSYQSPNYVPNFSPPWASGQVPDFSSNGYPNLSNPFVPGHFRQEGYHFPDRPTSPPVEVRPDPQMEQMKKQLELLQYERRQQEESKKQAEMEKRIREDAERAFKIRMEEMQRAQDEARQEIELAKIAAERAARERLEAEREAQEKQREAEKKDREYAMVKAELEVRQRLEEAMERKQRTGLRDLFTRSSKR